MNEPTFEDIAAMRNDGDLEDYFRSLIGRPAKTKTAPLAAAPGPAYRITHPGGWPLGTAASGPTPPADQCTCAKCGGNPNARPHDRQEGEVA